MISIDGNTLDRFRAFLAREGYDAAAIDLQMAMLDRLLETDARIGQDSSRRHGLASLMAFDSLPREMRYRIREAHNAAREQGNESFARVFPDARRLTNGASDVPSIHDHKPSNRARRLLAMSRF